MRFCVWLCYWLLDTAIEIINFIALLFSIVNYMFTFQEFLQTNPPCGWRQFGRTKVSKGGSSGGDTVTSVPITWCWRGSDDVGPPGEHPWGWEQGKSSKGIFQWWKTWTRRGFIPFPYYRTILQWAPSSPAEGLRFSAGLGVYRVPSSFWCFLPDLLSPSYAVLEVTIFFFNIFELYPCFFQFKSKSHRRR